MPTNLEPWHFACKGKARLGDTPGMSSLHVWRRRENRTAFCLKCSIELTVEQAANCFAD
jgi:hypothetical protein